MMSDIHFARSEDVHIAYRTVGEGDVDIVYVQGAFSHLEVLWELGPFRTFCERIGEFARLILFDKRGMGMSDRVPGGTPLEVRMDDIRAVMDAAGSERAVIMGASEGGPLALLFAAAHPERTISLILMGAEVRERKDDEWPWGEATPEEFDAAMERVDEVWGQGGIIARLAPSVADQPWAREWAGRQQLNSCTPGAAEAFMRMAFDIDVRDIVPTVRVPALVLHAEGDRICHVENGRYLARTLPEATYVELPGNDHAPWFQPEATLAEIQRFVTGHSGPVMRDRVLTTVAFVDIVDSTGRASNMGDHAWRGLLEAYSEMADSELSSVPGSQGVLGRRWVPGHFRRPRPGHPLCPSHRHQSPRPRPGDPGGRPHGRSRARRRRHHRHHRAHRVAPRGDGPAQRGSRLGHRPGPGGRIGHRLRGAWRPPAEGCARTVEGGGRRLGVSLNQGGGVSESKTIAIDRIPPMVT